MFLTRYKTTTHRAFPSFLLKRDPCPWWRCWWFPAQELFCRSSVMIFTNTIDGIVMSNARRREQCRRTPGVRAGGRANGWQSSRRGADRGSVTAIARKNLTSYLHWPYLPVRWSSAVLKSHWPQYLALIRSTYRRYARSQQDT